MDATERCRIWTADSGHHWASSLPSASHTHTTQPPSPHAITHSSHAVPQAGPDVVPPVGHAPEHGHVLDRARAHPHHHSQGETSERRGKEERRRGWCVSVCTAGTSRGTASKQAQQGKVRVHVQGWSVWCVPPPALAREAHNASLGGGHHHHVLTVGRVLSARTCTIASTLSSTVAMLLLSKTP